MVGTVSDADDGMQEVVALELGVSRSVEQPQPLPTRIVTRLSLDRLKRSRAGSRRRW